MSQVRAATPPERRLHLCCACTADCACAFWLGICNKFDAIFACCTGVPSKSQQAVPLSHHPPLPVLQARLGQ
jgi:hypothetical protein